MVDCTSMLFPTFIHALVCSAVTLVYLCSCGAPSQPPQPSPDIRAVACEREAWRGITVQEIESADMSEGDPDLDTYALFEGESHGHLDAAYYNWVQGAGLVFVRAGDAAIFQHNESRELELTAHQPLPGVSDMASVSVQRVGAGNHIGNDQPEVWVRYSADGAVQLLVLELPSLDVLTHVSPVCSPTLSIADTDCDGQRELRVDSGC